MRPRNSVLIFAVVILLAGMVILNIAAGRITPKGHEEEEQEQAAAAQKQTPPVGHSTPAPAPPAETSQGAAPLARLPADSTVGPASAKKQVTIGWTWTPEVQADPDRVAAAIAAVRKAAPDAKVRIVNTDAVPDAPAGITVDGKKVMELPEDGALDPSQAVKAVESASPAPKGP